jgi:hypothetical protein
MKKGAKKSCNLSQISAFAKKIRRKGEAWSNAIKRASKQIHTNVE